MDDATDSLRDPRPDAGTISPATLQQWLESEGSVTVLDVRMPADVETWQIEGPGVEFHSRPYYELLDGEATLEAVPKGDPLVVVCGEGEASETVASQLAAAGRAAVSLEGGMEDWATHYAATEIGAVDSAGRMFQYHRPATGCLSYLVVSDGAAAVIDPLLAFVDQYRENAAEVGADLEYAIDTHCHADHLSGVRELAADGTTGIVPAASADRGMSIDDGMETIIDGESVSVGEVSIAAVHTPGHTTDMTSYRIDDRVLLTGDALFVESVGRPDLEAGAEGAREAARQLHESLQERILPLADDVLIAGGHRATAERPGRDGTYTARLGRLRETLPVLSMAEDAFVDHVSSKVPPRPANYERIVATNLGRESVDDEDATRIELGPNNCAAADGVAERG
jgi:glyoxylase-like metal-dependent hydrolase (beta-lactamase superfamily II)